MDFSDKMLHWVNRFDKEVRVFFCLRQEKTLFGTKFMSVLSDVPRAMWEDCLQEFCIAHADDLMGLTKDGCMGASQEVKHKRKTTKYIYRFTYLGSDIKSKDRGHGFMWETKLCELPPAPPSAAADPTPDPC